MVRRVRKATAFASALGCAAVGMISCSDQEKNPPAEAQPTPDRTDQRAAELATVKEEAPRWVSIYDPERAWSGYTLSFFKRTIPILIDMNGEIVHSWPQARVRARLRLLPNGNLLAIGLGKGVIEYDWDGRLVWEFKIDDGYAHHDVIRLENGNTMLIAAKKGDPTDDLLEVTPDGRVVWEWRSAEFLLEYFGDQPENARDITHVNSLQVLPANPWFDAGDERFRPGNVLVSARNLDTAFLIDRETREVVWSYATKLDRQHEAMMIGKDLPGHGNILIFNNGLKGRYYDRQSAILELQPLESEIVWEYRSTEFYSPFEGVQQILPNGNLLVGSSLGPRNFEITRDGEIVWQWTPPFRTKRPWRYSYDFCPQMRDLAEPGEVPVVPSPGYRHVDRMTYRYSRGGDRRKVDLEGKSRTVLRSPGSCREFTLPAEAQVSLTFGVDREALYQAGHRNFRASFVARLRSTSDSIEQRSISTVIDPGSSPWQSVRWRLGGLAFEQVELCLEAPTLTDEGEEIEASSALWGSPRILGVTDRLLRKTSSEGGPLEQLSQEELEVRDKHLKTLGYID